MTITKCDRCHDEAVNPRRLALKWESSSGNGEALKTFDLCTSCANVLMAIFMTEPGGPTAPWMRKEMART